MIRRIVIFWLCILLIPAAYALAEPQPLPYDHYLAIAYGNPQAAPTVMLPSPFTPPDGIRCFAQEPSVEYGVVNGRPVVVTGCNTNMPEGSGVKGAAFFVWDGERARTILIVGQESSPPEVKLVRGELVGYYWTGASRQLITVVLTPYLLSAMEQ